MTDRESSPAADLGEFSSVEAMRVGFGRHHSQQWVEQPAAGHTHFDEQRGFAPILQAPA
ncbi:hypothetical protein ACLGIH_01615 [Streptomyces sp. HMX87]|uniref:hypothetical protein n=1 Tax=Streptomyces sp. HMX87 TaxID=3390849 RepID=UPI003A883F80